MDIARNRRRHEYSNLVIARRVLWGICQPVFRYSPRPMFAWRAWLLRLFGAEVGRHAHIYNSVRIYMPWNLKVGDWSAIGEWALIYNLGVVCLGQKATVSHGAHLCAGTHDYERQDLPLIRKNIMIEDQAWICADAFVGPGVLIGRGAVVGARAVAVKDVGPWDVVAGNPARKIGSRTIRAD